MNEENSQMQRATTPVQVSRRYPAAPLIGVAAIVFNETGAVLLVRRGKPPRAGQWGLPGGLLDLGEPLADGVRREVMEECAIDIAVGDLVGAFEPIQYDEAGRLEYHYVVLDYWARYLSGTAVARDDAQDVAWVTEEELAHYRLNQETAQIIATARLYWKASSD